MTPDDSSGIDQILNRPMECMTLEMELKTAIGLKDGSRCRELLLEGAKWLAMFESHELAELLDAAIHAGSLAEEIVELLLESGVPAHSVYDRIGPDYQHTPLVTAAKSGRLDLVQKLVAAGADVFWVSPTGMNALSEIWPSRAPQDPMRDSPDVSRVRAWLLQQGVRMDPRCMDSLRKLLWASFQPISWPDIPDLLEMGIPLSCIGWTPFMLKLASGHANLGDVAALNSEELLHRDKLNRTPFLLAVQAGNLEVSKALLERGSDLHVRGYCGKTALHAACEQNDCVMAGWLLDIGMPLDVLDDFGGSSLYTAVAANSVDMARVLLEKGADVHERCKHGYGLIHQVSWERFHGMCPDASRGWSQCECDRLRWMDLLVSSSL